MENEKIIKSENEKEIVRIFRKLTASGVVNGDKAAEIIMRDYPHFFRHPTENEVKQTFNSVMNSELRARAQQTNRLADGIFTNVLPTNKTPS
jgi:lysophospholipase L1-like esterase